MERHAIRSGDVDDEKGGCQTAFEMWIWRRMERTSWTEHRTNEEVLKRWKKKISDEYTRQQNWVGRIILRGDSLQIGIGERMEGNAEEEGLDKTDGLDDGGRIRKTQGKGTTSRRVEPLDIWTCREADDLKKKRS